MLASRPVLLHALIKVKSLIPGDDDTHVNIRQTLRALSDACIHAARHSHALIVEEWTNGSLPIFGYFYAHYLFSAALVMVISSQIYPENGHDFLLFEAAFEILRVMSDHGNLAATEFHDNLACIQQCLDRSTQAEVVFPQEIQSVNIIENPTDSLSMNAPHQQGKPTNASTSIANTTTTGTLNNDVAFLGESMEAFLAQPDIDFEFLDPSMNDSVYSWPNLSLWTG